MYGRINFKNSIRQMYGPSASFATIPHIIAEPTECNCFHTFFYYCIEPCTLLVTSMVLTLILLLVCPQLERFILSMSVIVGLIP